MKEYDTKINKLHEIFSLGFFREQLPPLRLISRLGPNMHCLRSYQSHWYECQSTTFSNIIHLVLAVKSELETIDDENENTSSPIF